VHISTSVYVVLAEMVVSCMICCQRRLM